MRLPVRAAKRSVAAPGTKEAAKIHIAKPRTVIIEGRAKNVANFFAFGNRIKNNL